MPPISLRTDDVEITVDLVARGVASFDVEYAVIYSEATFQSSPETGGAFSSAFSSAYDLAGTEEYQFSSAFSTAFSVAA